MKKFSVLFLAAVLLAPLTTKADGGFVTVKFVWDKHRDIAEPTQKAIIVYAAGREDLILQVKYEGSVDQLGWLIPVPNLPRVQKGSMKCFYELSQYTQQHFGGGGYPIPASLGMDHPAGQAEPPVKVVEIKTVGAYEIAVLSAQHSDALRNWLRDNDFYLPPDKYDVVDSYIERNWYFVAVKIKPGGWFPSFRSISGKLASGELNPLQISFASDRCLFPLKISSINGKPSEVQVYVLSAEPLLEMKMLQKNLPLIYSNDMERAGQMARWRESTMDRARSIERQRFGGVPPDADASDAIQEWNARPFPLTEELLPYAHVTKTDLPECRRLIPTLGGKSWWLAKHSWTFEPQEMRDLTFEPALPVFNNMLGSKYGYFAADGLCSFGSDGLSVLLRAMQDPNAAVRTNAASVFNNMNNWGNIYEIANDPRVTNAALAWIKDSEPAVRMAGLYMLNRPGRPNTRFAGPLLALLKDPDPLVRHCAVFGAGREENDPVSQEVITILLQNSDPMARMDGITILYRNANKQSVELALPLLNDPNPFVKELAGSTLRALTGQDFTDDQGGEWEKWWNENKTNFAVQLRRQEFGLHPIER
ncbi:MAG TPA: DUF2330 domain-containing protein [Verrucomicrobiae bacterium]|nr:DUF2330 domain-containing protein [Verrucomicrobiae bacterium]